MEQALAGFHPAIAGWFADSFAAPTAVQREAWAALRAGRPALLAAPTGSGKTLAAFLAAIDELVREGRGGGLPDETRVLYVSPLKALSNDIRKNLEEPLAGIAARLSLLEQVEIRAAVRTGDTPAQERARMRRQPPHILVTTPESLYILLTAESGRQMLSTVRTVIVDELHAVAATKRGAHLALSLERLESLCPRPPLRIGISATQKPLERMLRFLLGARDLPSTVVDTGYMRERDLALELPRSPLQPIMPAEAWAEIHDRLEELVRGHRSTLVFVNTRRLAERLARHLAERLGEDAVTAHHGSLAREHRLDAETRLKAGRLKALVATASLELGIDIGDVDLVCQVGSPRGIAPLLQRVGRSGHGVGRVPKGRLFPLSRDDLVECAALLDAVRRAELDAISVQGPALDVLAQQVTAEVACGERDADELYAQFTRAWPYRDLTRAQFEAVLRMLGEGFATFRGRRAAHLHYDRVNGRLRARPGTRLTAITNGGAIPDQFDYDVVLQPQGFQVGTLNEDFAFESMPGDIFQLGNASYRILRVETGKVHVEDARGQPPTIPFWFGEAPGRSDELSAAVSRLREQVAADLADGEAVAQQRLEQELGLAPVASGQLVEYLSAARAALGLLPTQQAVVLERFFDEVGDTHLVIHSPFGSRLNRAWGLALRKRFCRKFNFELQAAALEDSIVLSLGPTHSFPLEEVARYLNAASVRQVLTQALLAAPMFPTRWRWVATTALAIRRNRNGRRVPPQFQRSDADDLLALVFPDQVACAENLPGEREIPDHPLVTQAIHDCLHELMDIDGLERLLGRIAAGEVEVIARELTSPSPLAQEIIAARPYAFLDDVPAEERRTQAIRSRHLLDAGSAAELGRLDPAAIARVCAEAWPEARSADELHDALTLTGFIPASEARERGGAHWPGLLDELVASGRATRLRAPGLAELWASAERLGQLLACLPGLDCEPPLAALEPAGDATVALREISRSRLETLGPVTADELAAPLGLSGSDLLPALLALEVDGQAMRGRYREGARGEEWCDRRLLARIHRLTLRTLRSAVQPVSQAACMRFLFDWQGLAARGQGPDALRGTLARLLGYPAPAVAWEQQLLPARIEHYSRHDLDGLLAGGEFQWLRAPVEPASEQRRSGPVRATPVMFIDRDRTEAWQALLPAGAGDAVPLSSAAQRLQQALEQRGAMFFVDLVRQTGLLRTQVETALGELVAWGLVSSDGFAGLRALVTPAAQRARFSRPVGRRGISIDGAGRWSLLAPLPAVAGTPAATVEHAARLLLDRYGIVFRALLAREARWLPPWRELVRMLRRLEARGELRGGRFVDGFSGEQFALPEAVEALRSAARRVDSGDEIIVCGADPLNLTGIITPGERIPALAGNRVLYRNGSPVAAQAGGAFRWLAPASGAEAEWNARNALLRTDPRATLASPPPRPV
jgi:ATP-dependent Lhr-like helicase